MDYIAALAAKDIINKIKKHMQPETENIISKALKALEKEYIVVGKTRVRSWHAWLAIGVAAGITAGILFVANRSAEFEEGFARKEDIQDNVLQRGGSFNPKRASRELIVKLKGNSFAGRTVSEQFAPLTAAEKNITEKYKLKSLKKVIQKHRLKGDVALRAKQKGVDLIYVAAIPQGANESDVAEGLRRDPQVEYVEPNYEVRTFLSPNDPLFGQLWGMHNTGQTGGKDDADIDSLEAWDVASASSIVVGVIDTGVDYTHEDLAKNIWTNPGEVPGDKIDNDGNGFVDDVYGWDFINEDNDPMDDHGHGTHVAGTIGAVGNNGVGVVGVNWNAKIAALKFLSAGGSGTIADAVEAVQYANMMGFKITSNSWGGGGFSQALYDAIAAADNKGNLFIAAAGNSGADSDQSPMFPAAYNLPNIISVAATDHNDERAYFSNYGLNSVDLGAPGLNTVSSVPKSGCSLCNPSGYRALSGTSMATPHVSGAAALLWAKFPGLSHLAVKDRILGATDPLPALNGKTVSGGRLNLNNLFEIDNIPPLAVTDLNVVKTLTSHSAITLEWKAVGDDGLSGRASRYDIRYSTIAITKDNFGSTMQVKDAPRPATSGSSELFSVKGLDQATTYYFAIKVYDNLGNASPISNIVSAQTSKVTTAFFDDVESKISWVIDGTDGKGGSALWHISERRKPISPTHAWYYGLESSGNFDTGARNFGGITSPEIDLSFFSGAELTFQHFLQTENFPPYDTASVQISSDGGKGQWTPWTTLWGKNSTNGAWLKESIDLAKFSGQKIKVRFFFDTVDALYNYFEGWYIDDVKIVGTVSGLLGGWHFDETSGTVASDFSGNGINGTLIRMDPATDWVSGKVNGALDFDGTNDYVNLGSNLTTLSNKSAVTLAAWIRRESVFPGWINGVVSFSVNSGVPTVNSRAAIDISSSGKVRILGRSTDREAERVISTALPVIIPNTWHHIAGVIDYAGDFISVYVDGVLVASGPVNFSQSSTPNTPSSYAVIGAQDNGTGVFFDGQIDEVYVFSRALNAADIVKLYKDR